MHHRSVVVMGPSGSGKSVIGASLAGRLGMAFLDGDDLHPAANVAKMAAGIPLDDTDRMPWLDAVGAVLAAHSDGVVVACSALRRAYRDRLRDQAADAVFVELDIDGETLRRRMSSRRHFMPASLLDSQLAALQPLEPDEPGVVVRNDGTPDEVVDRIVSQLPAR